MRCNTTILHLEARAARARVGARSLLVLAACLAALSGTGGRVVTGACLMAAPAESQFCPEHGKLATGDASTIDPRGVEVELGYSLEGGAHGIGLDLGVGMIENLDLGLGTEFAIDGDARGFGDIGVGGRWRFLQIDAPRLELAVSTGTTVPTGAAEIGQGYWSWDNALAASADFTRLTANAELRFGLPVNAGEAGSALGANLALGWQFADWLQPEVELNYERELLADGENELALTAGLILLLSDLLMVKAGVMRGLTGDDPATGVVAGLKLAF